MKTESCSSQVESPVRITQTSTDLHQHSGAASWAQITFWIEAEPLSFYSVKSTGWELSQGKDAWKFLCLITINTCQCEQTRRGFRLNP